MKMINPVKISILIKKRYLEVEISELLIVIYSDYRQIYANNVNTSC